LAASVSQPSPRADPFGKAAESRSKLLFTRDARLGFARIIEHPGKAD
jgi:hypothetical protein